MKRLTILCFAACALLSCGIYGRYERPQLDVQADTLSLPSWRGVFADAALQALIDTALSRNTNRAVALLRVEEAEATLSAARLAFLPSLSLTGGANLYETQNLSLGARSSWELDLVGRRRNGKRSAAAALWGSKTYARAVQTSLVASVATAYYTLLMLDAQLSISEQTLLNWDKSISVLESLKMAGKTNDIAVLQARAKKMNLEASSVSIRGNIAKAENALCALLGVPQRSIARGNLEGAELSFPWEGVALSTMAARPDVLQAEHALEQATYGTQGARAAFYPDLSLSGSLGWTSGGAPVTDPSAWIASALASLTAPVFSRGSNKASLRIAKARQEEAKLQYRQTLLDAGREVNDALAACQTAKERIEIDTRQQEALQQAVEKIELMMRYSHTNYLEVLTAQQSYLDAELKVVDDRVALIQGCISLYRALGGGAE